MPQKQEGKRHVLTRLGTGQPAGVGKTCAPNLGQSLSRHHLVNLNLCVRISVVIHSHIISV
jgi:hypothetical protein